MKNRLTLTQLALFVFLFVFTISCNDNTSEQAKSEQPESEKPIDTTYRNLARLLVKKQVFENMDVYFKLMEAGRPAINSLIDVIATNEIGFVGQVPMESSKFFPIDSNYTGIRAVHMIEKILTAMGAKRSYGIGLILKKGPKWPTRVSYNDMIIIKDLYSKWWEANKNTTDRQLVMIINNGNSPLSNTQYKWAD